MKMLLTSVLWILGLSSQLVRAEEPFLIYAPSPTSKQLLVVEATPTDEGLTLKLNQKLDLGFNAAYLAQHPEKPLLYVAPPGGEEGKTPAAVVKLSEQGTKLESSPVTLAHGTAYLSVDRAGRFLLSADYGQGFVDVYALDKNGMPGQRVAALNEGRRNAHCILPTPDNRFIYIPYVKDIGAILQYRFDAETGRLTALEPHNANPPEGTGPRHIAYHPSLPIAYFSNEQHLGVSAYDRQENGQLKLREVCNAVDENEPKEGVSSSDLQITPDGRYLFAGIRGHQRPFDWISRYRIQDNGDLEFLGLTHADKIPWGLTLSPGGEYLLVTAYEGATLTAYRIGEDGSLTKAASLNWDKHITDLVTRPAPK